MRRTLPRGDDEANDDEDEVKAHLRLDVEH